MTSTRSDAADLSGENPAVDLPSTPPPPSSNPLVRKLASFAPLGAADVRALEALTADARRRPAGAHLIREGDAPAHVFMLMSGWAYRYKLLADGRRQILAFLLPGDVCDVHIFVLKKMDHGIALLDDAEVVAVPGADMLRLIENHRGIERALWWATLVDEAILREWLTGMGQRDARTRIAHLLVELWLRMRLVGLAEGGAFSLPLTQTEIADATGLTPVSVNRALQALRAERLITLESQRLTIHDAPGLMAVSNFEANYLHMGVEEAPAVASPDSEKKNGAVARK